jgi:hypothetical protein
VGRGLLRRTALLGLVVLAPAAFAATAGADPTTPVYPSSGAFAIGDGNATVGSGSEVTFWGAQWWKDNTPSQGTAPPAFKGYADTPSDDPCGPFTTKPGNSSEPPAGPLPPVMLALVTDSVTKSGSTIMGDVVGIAVIDTDSGYEPDPGHPGTGTVVGFTPCSDLGF